MNTAILIASRELREKSRLFLTALAMAAVPFLVALVPAARRGSARELVTILSGMLSLSMCVGIAATLGVNTIGRELADGRLSFYFSKPIPPVAIWVGKAAASIIAALVCFGIIVLPAMLFAGEVWTSTWLSSSDWFLWLTSIGAITTFFVMHTVATMVRSRSPLLALDFALAVGTGIAVTTILRPLFWAEARGLAYTVAGFMAIAAVIVLAIAPGWQLAIGRADRRRSHAALSKALWIGVAIILLIAAAFVGWVVSGGPEDLQGELDVAQAPASGWMFVSGKTRSAFDYRSTFLIGPDGTHQRTGHTWWGSSFSRDGRVVAWQHLINRKFRQTELYTRDLTRPDAEPVATGIITVTAPFVLSDDGSRVAIAESQNLSVHDLKTGRLLVSARVFADSTSRHFYFASPNVVRTIQSPQRRTAKEKVTPVLVELDVARRVITKTGVVEPLETPFAVASPDGTKLIFRRNGLLVDARTGATLAQYGRIGFTPLILRDGAVIVPSEWSQPAQVTVHRSGAAPLKVALPGMMYASVRGEIAPGKVAVQAGSKWVSGNNAKLASVFIINTITGTVERVDQNTRGPLVAWNYADPRPIAIDTGQLLAAYDGAGKLVMWNPLTGEKTRPKFSQ